MADDAIDLGGQQQPAAETAAQTTQQATTAVPPSPARDAAAGANTAPAPKDVAREAFARLEKGDRPDAVNKALYQQRGKAAANAQAGTPGPSAETPQGDKSTDGQSPAGAQQQDQGITPDDLQVLRRAKFDLSTWKHIPPSNRKAIVANLKASQAEADRQFQQGRQGAGVVNPAQANQPATTQTTPQDGATQAGGEQRGAAQPQPAPQGTQPQQQPADANANAFNPLAGVDPKQFVDDKDLETLRTLGGDELAETHTRGIARAVGYMQQQVQPLMGMVQALVGNWEQQEFRDALGELRKQPGFDQLTSEQEGQIRARAELLIRSAGDIQNYRFREAVSDAAASLFRSNVHQAVQKQLLQGRRESLQGTPDRGERRAADGRPLTGKDRDRAIFDKLRDGLTPDDARRAVDGR